MGYSLRTERYRYTKWVNSNGSYYESELYDYQEDPMETINFSNNPDYKPIVNQLDSIVSERILHPSTQKKILFRVTGRNKLGDTVDIDPGSIATARFNQLLEKRGYQNPGRIKLMTEFPLGLFIAWTWVDLSMRCLVYPVPATTAPTIPSIDSQSGEEQAEGVGLDDFAGLRKFQPGDSWRRISWKAAGRLDELYSKEFTGGQPERQWIDWLTIDEASQEVRLSIMTRLVLDAQQAGRQYGLRLPGLEIKPDNGSSHQHHCLKALALYRLGE